MCRLFHTRYDVVVLVFGVLGAPMKQSTLSFCRPASSAEGVEGGAGGGVS